MANLKQDLLNNLGNEKYYGEIELSRLAADPNAVYGEKIQNMSELLKDLAEIDLATQLVGKYFQEPVEGQPEGQPVVEAPAEQPEQPAKAAHPGQTHAE